jgi:hypothetical protein
MKTDFEPIAVRMTDTGGEPVVELPWAEALLATEFGGDYRLRNDLFLAPLCRGDVLRCEVTGDHTLQVVDIRQLMPGLLIGFEHPRGTEGSVKRVLRDLRSIGYQVRRPFDGCVQVFVPGAELDRDFPFARLPKTWERRLLLDGPFRMRAAMEQIDFSLATDPFSGADLLDHREPHHPAWARLEPELVLPG